MKKQILIYGLCGGVLIVLLKLVEYRLLVVEHSIEIYGGLVALLFAVLGIWLGLKLTKTKETVVVKEILLPSDTVDLGRTVFSRLRRSLMSIVVDVTSPSSSVGAER
jgi:hypothetical protein